MRRALLALSAVLVLLPGALVAAAVQTGQPKCADMGCGCPAPDENRSGPALTAACCCEFTPAPAPSELPDEPLLVAKGWSSDSADCPDFETAQPLTLPRSPAQVERLDLDLRSYSDLLFLRHQSLRL